MKKFQFAASLLALAMLGACSSDAPDAPVTGTDNGEEGGTYVAMRISTNNVATRATDANAKSGESTINSLSVYIVLDGDTKVHMVADELVADADNDVVYAYFNIGSGRQTALEGLKGETVDIYAYANLSANNVTPAGAYDASAYTTVDTWKSNNFLMTNNEAATGTFSDTKRKFTPKDATEEVEVWVLNAGDKTKGEQIKIELERLACRFDYKIPTADVTKDNKVVYNATTQEYTALNNENLKLKITKLAINTHETKTFWFRQSTTTGMTPDADKKFAGSDYCTKALSAQNWNLSPTNLYTYARPHYVNDGVELGYNTCSYVAIKASFQCPTSLKTAAQASQNPDVYAFDGILLGSFDYLSTKTGADYGQEANSTLGYLLQGVTDETTFAANPHVEKYTYNTDDNCYYTYYNRYLTKTKVASNAEATNDNVDLVRNTIYNIGVNSLAGLGQNGTKAPNDPSNTDTKIWVDLDVTVAAWLTNSANDGMAIGR